jgi:Domain of unknown function (DUF5615)
LKLLFDENLAPSLALILEDIFPQSQHVARIELGALSDREVWEYAKEHHYTLGQQRFRLPRTEPVVSLATKGRLDSPWQLLYQTD